MRDIVGIIHAYAAEEGYKVFGNRFTGQGFYFDLDIYRQQVDVLFNGNTRPIYKIKNVKDCVNFCLVLSSIYQSKHINQLI
ncbi:hypothetical protein [Vibrio campbellii]|uniref:hypothetical protein n=1 Tax=Vibrio campbellii TaxID=680 RepID=UPI0005EE28AC|nr:hypothetical protein [Vibrio campbellii]